MQELVAVLGEDALRMKLDPLDTKRLVTNTHDQSIRRLRCDGQTRRECVDSSDKRVVSNNKKLFWNLAEDTECIVVDGRGLPMHDLPTHCDCALHTPRRSPDGQDTHQGSASVQQIVGSHPHWHLPHSVLLVLGDITMCVIVFASIAAKSNLSFHTTSIFCTQLGYVRHNVAGEGVKDVNHQHLHSPPPTLSPFLPYIFFVCHHSSSFSFCCCLRMATREYKV